MNPPNVPSNRRVRVTAFALGVSGALLLAPLALGARPGRDANGEKVVKKEVILRRDRLSEQELRSQLSKFAVVSLDDKVRVSSLIHAHALKVQRPVAAATQQQAAPAEGPRPLSITPALLRRWVALGLPVQTGPQSQLTSDAADTLQAYSKGLKAFLGASVRFPDPKGPKEEDEALGTTLWVTPPNAREIRVDLPAPRPNENPRDYWRRPLCEVLGVVPGQELPADRVPALEQILQTAELDRRLLLVELLAGSKSRAATAALARRALYDLSAKVRAEAILALQKRPVDRFRQLLLNGLRHPWPPVADHAAEALVALRDRAALPALLALLTALPPDVAGPAAVREVVRIQHTTNCLLCHAATLRDSDPVAMVVPGQLTSEAVGLGGWGGGYGLGGMGAAIKPAGPPPLFVRADVTYLRQDFSALLAEDERFDFVVRTRRVSASEIAERLRARATTPQHEAVRFAIRHLREGVQAAR
jgi:hypothetical protein